MKQPAILLSSLSLLVSVLACSLAWQSSQTSAPVSPPPAAIERPEPPPSVEIATLREEVASLRHRVSGTPASPSQVQEPAAAPNPEREQMLQEMTAMWKAAKARGGAEGPGLGRLPLGLAEEGPVVGEPMIKTLGLQPNQVQAINEALQAAYREYLALEAQHVEKKRDPDGTLRVAISPFEAEGKAFAERLWGRLDSLLDERQREVSRMHLRPQVHDLFLELGASKVTIEISREAGGYSYREKTGWSNISGSSSEIPPKLRRFWSE